MAQSASEGQAPNNAANAINATGLTSSKYSTNESPQKNSHGPATK
jgi:hypothetical protein